MTQSVIDNPQNPVTVFGTDADGNTTANVPTTMQAGSVWSYGPHPEDRYTASTVTNASAADNAAFGTLTDMDNYEGLIFDATTGEVSVQLSIDGTTFPATTVNHLFVDLGTPATAVTDAYKGYKLVTGTTSGVGPFLIHTPCKGLRFCNEGAAAATVAYAQVGKVSI